MNLDDPFEEMIVRAQIGQPAAAIRALNRYIDDFASYEAGVDAYANNETIITANEVVRHQVFREGKRGNLRNLVQNAKRVIQEGRFDRTYANSLRFWVEAQHREYAASMESMELVHNMELLNLQRQ